MGFSNRKIDGINQRESILEIQEILEIDYHWKIIKFGSRHYVLQNRVRNRAENPIVFRARFSCRSNLSIVHDRARIVLARFSC